MENSNNGQDGGFWKGFALALIAMIVIGGIITAIVLVDSNPQNPTQRNKNSQKNSAVVASIGDDPVKGQENASVTLIKFTDFKCPFCNKWYQQTYPTLKDKYIDTGKLKVVYKDAPIEKTHPSAPKVHNFANCVFERNGSESYFDYVDSIYDNQKNLTENNLVKLGSELGMQLSSCESSDYSGEIDEDMDEARKAGLTGTPHFVIKKTGEESGIPIKGAQPPKAFSQLIDSKLENGK